MRIKEQAKKGCRGVALILHPLSFILRRPRRRGQAMTEVVLLFPIFMVIVFMMAKLFAILVLVQKLEIASYYAARRWQLESHLNAQYEGDDGILEKDILKKVEGYLGFSGAAASGGKFLGISEVKLKIDRTQVWNVVNLTVLTSSFRIGLLCNPDMNAICHDPKGVDYGPNCDAGYKYLCTEGGKLEVIKYVPNRDRPIQFVLPGLQ